MSNKYKILFPNSSKDQVTIYGEEKTLLSTIRSGQPTLADYFFLDKDDKIIEQDKEEKVTIKEVLKDKSQIFMNKKKEGSKEQKTQEKDYYIVIKDKKSQVLVKACETDLISTLRKHSQTQNNVFISLSGAQISSFSQGQMKISQISSGNKIKMKAKIDEKLQKQQNDKELQKKQKEKAQSLNKLIDNIKVLKGDIKQQKNKQKMNQISKDLKQYGVSIQPSKIPSDLQRAAIIQTLDKKRNNCQDIIKQAKKIPSKTEAERYASSGVILPSIFLTEKKTTQTKIAVDFQRSQKTLYDKEKKNYKITIIEYNTNQNSSVKVDLSKQLKYDFNGGSLSAGGYGITAKVQAGKAELHSSQNVETKQGVQKDEIFNQTFIAYCVTNAIYFHKDDISLKQEVVKEFEKIVSQYQKTNSKDSLHKNIRLFTDTYGISISSSVYLLGGYFQKAINYKFFSEASSKQLSSIIRNQTQFTLKGGVGGAYGGFSAEAGYEHNTKSTDQKGWTDKKTKKRINYKTTYKHQSAPLSSVQDIDQWREILEAFPQNWTVVGQKDEIEISITQLLRSSRNSINQNPQFLKIKKEVLREFEDPVNPIHLQLSFDKNQNYNLRQDQFIKRGEPYQEYQILGNHSLPDRKINYYNVKVTKSKQMEIAIGICSDDCKSNQYSAARKNDVIYYHLAGRGMIECGNERKRVGVIVKQHDKIRVEVDLRRKKSISWYVNDKIVGTQQIPTKMLGLPIYPYFHMLTNDDCISFD